MNAGLVAMEKGMEGRGGRFLIRFLLNLGAWHIDNHFFFQRQCTLLHNLRIPLHLVPMETRLKLYLTLHNMDTITAALTPLSMTDGYLATIY